MRNKNKKINLIVGMMIVMTFLTPFVLADQIPVTLNITTSDIYLVINNTEWHFNNSVADYNMIYLHECSCNTTSANNTCNQTEISFPFSLEDIGTVLGNYNADNKQWMEDNLIDEGCENERDEYKDMFWECNLSLVRAEAERDMAYNNKVVFSDRIKERDNTIIGLVIAFVILFAMLMIVLISYFNRKKSFEQPKT